jgi:hypothetical protein
MIGVVDVTDQDTHHVVNVEFHDKSADRRGYHFQDHNRFHLAAVGEQIRLERAFPHCLTEHMFFRKFRRAGNRLWISRRRGSSRSGALPSV